MLSKNLTFYREKMGLSKRKLSFVSGLSRKTITDIELGYTTVPSLQTIQILAHALNVEVADLIK